MDLKVINDLYRHMEWADATVWASLNRCEAAQTDRKLRDYLYHLHMVQRAFLRVWRGEPRDTPYPTFTETAELMIWARTYYDEAFAHLRTVSDERLAETAVLPWADMVTEQLGRPPEISTVGEITLQVPLHSLYHRGQVNARLRELGGHPPLVDFIAWVWMGRPAADWSAVGL